jgi:hypothetical protein
MVVSSESRRANNIAVIRAINPKASRYCQKCEKKEELRIGAEFIIPFSFLGNLDIFHRITYLPASESDA